MSRKFRFSKDKLLVKILQKGYKLIFIGEADFTLSIIRNNGSGVKDPGYVGIGIYKVGRECFADVWVRIDESDYEFIEECFKDIGGNYLHHEVIFRLNQIGNKKLCEVL